MSCPITGLTDPSVIIPIVGSDETSSPISASSLPLPIGPLPGVSNDCGEGDYYIGDLIFIADDAPPIL